VQLLCRRPRRMWVAEHGRTSVHANAHSACQELGADKARHAEQSRLHLPEACAAPRSAGRELEARAERDTPSDHTFVPWVTIDGRAVGAECGAPLRLLRGQAWPACSASGLRRGPRESAGHGPRFTCPPPRAEAGC